jgi:hypothetical protein
MRVSLFLATVVAATLAGPAAEASVSVTINFPAAGDGWCGTDNGVGTCGTLTSGGYSGNMQEACDFVTSSLSNADGYPIPAGFVATGISGFLYVSGSTAYTLLQVGPYAGGDISLIAYVGPGAVPFSFTFAPTPFYTGGPFNVVLVTDVPQTNPSVGNWIQIGTGSLTVTGSIVPEPSTWTMMVAGFVGLGFAGYRASRKSAAIGV